MRLSDKERLKKIVKLWSDLKTQLNQHNITKEKLLNDQFSQWAVTTPIYNIGEQVYKISVEFKENHQDLPWSKVSGLRHRLFHEYDEINWTLIADIVFRDMETFVNSVEELLNNM